jgi:hypothetical protein
LLAAASALLLAACSGGGGGGPARPTVSLNASKSVTSANAPVDITWTSANASACSASGGWSGTLPASGTRQVVLTTEGQVAYTITCTGDGGTASTTVTIGIPNAVKRTSYENAKNIDLRGDIAIPLPSEVGIASPTWFHAGFAYGDFFRDGSFAIVAAMAQSSQPFNQPAIAGVTVGADRPSRIHFLRRGADGKWRDATSQLLSDQTGCIVARKAIVADFNRDDRPDVFFACQGLDVFPAPPGQVLGERQRLLLSQADGRYTNIELPVTAYARGASAADLNGDGHVDIVLANTIGPELNPAATTNQQPFVLLNDGSGRAFSVDTTRLPSTWQAKALFSFELIDVRGTGAPDLFAGGYTPEASATPRAGIGNVWAKNDGSGRFGDVVALPNTADSQGRSFDIAQDFVWREGRLFVLQTALDYDAVAVRRVELPGLAESFVYRHTGAYAAAGWKWFPWMHPDADGTMRALCTALAPPTDPNYSASAWAVRFQR